MFSHVSVKKPMTVFVCVVLVAILGVISFMNMTTDLLPSMDLPYVIAYTTYVGASPEQVEESVTKTMESALATTNGVKTITSVSQENVSIVIMEFEQGSSMDSAMIEMTTSLEQISGSLPEGTGSPMLMKLNPDMLPIMVLAVDRDGMDLEELSKFAENTVIPALERVDGVASVSGSGLVENQIRIELDQEKLDDLNNRVLDAIDGTLADAEKELKDARKKIEEGKKTLEEQSGAAYEQLVEAAQQLESTREQISMGSTVTNAEVSALQGILDQYNDMVELKKNYYDSETKTAELLGNVDYLQLQALYAARNQLKQDLVTAEATLAAAEATLEEITKTEAELDADITAAAKVRDDARIAYDAAVAAGEGNMAGDPGWQELLDRETEARAEVTKLEEELQLLQDELAAETDPIEQSVLQAAIRAKEQDLAAARAVVEAIEAEKDAYILENDPAIAAAAETLADAEEALAAAEAEKTALLEAKDAKATAEADITQYEADLAANEDAIEALAGGDAAKLAAINNWVEVHDTVNQNYGSITELETLITEMEPRLPEIKKELEAAKQSQKEMNQALSQLENAQTQLELSKITASEEIIKATLQLEAAEQQLIAGEEEFKKQRDAAYEAAGLDGILTQATISQMLMAQNFSMPAGYIQNAEGQTSLKVGEKFESLEELQNWVLFSYKEGDIGDISLSDIAEVRLADNTEELYAKINGNDGVMLTIQKSSIASTSGACENLYEQMEFLQEKYSGLHFTALSDQGQYIELVVNSVLENLMYGAVLAVVILMIFLKDFRPTAIVALSIPVSLLLSIVLMYFTGVTLNMISLSGLALGVGMLVDNSIVAIENIYRLRQYGYNAATSAVYGCKQIGGAIAASTLTTVCVFAPILFTQGMTRELFSDMGLTIAYSLGASLLVALTVVPALSSKMLQRTAEQKQNRLLDRMIAGYENLLRTTLRHKAPVLLGAVALLIVSAVLVVNMGTAFLPEMDSPQVSVSMSMPEGSTTEEARDMCDDVIDAILTVEGVGTVGAMESAGLMGGEPSLSIYVLLNEKRSASSQEIAVMIEEATAGLDCTVTANGSTMDMSMMTGGSGVQIKVTGDDMDTLRSVATEIAETLQQVEGIDTVSDGQEDTGLEVRITVDKNKAAEYGLTVAQVYQQVAVAIAGETTATNITIENNTVPVVVVPDADAVTTRDTLRDLIIIGTKEGEEAEVKLIEIADIGDATAPIAINRENQARTLTVTASIADGYNIGLVSRDVTAALEGYDLPDGYSYEIAGENEMIESTMADLVLMIVLAIAFIYLIMVAQFQSLLSPFIVMFTIPLAFTGGLLALWLTGKELSIIAMLGFLMLAGVIVNNGIVFVDYVNQLRLEGADRTEALIQTGRDRIRPILMTALTTIFGLVTMAMGLGSGGDMLQPLAIVTIGGLTYGTLLTLFVVPCIYDIFLRKDLKKVEIEEVEEEW